MTFRSLELRTGRRSTKWDFPAYWGPFPLINTALNLVATRELDWQERRAESFVLSPLYCGSESTGYQLLPDDFRRDNMTLGRAVAMSGAAADPNMGHHTVACRDRPHDRIQHAARLVDREPVAALAGPGRRSSECSWSAESPSFGGLILKELTGQTDSVGHWVHLSDGGHFENLAAYELIRRRCRYLVISDAGCDPNLGLRRPRQPDPKVPDRFRHPHRDRHGAHRAKARRRGVSLGTARSARFATTTSTAARCRACSFTSRHR